MSLTSRQLTLTTSDQDIYVCPIGAQGAGHHLTFCNTSGTAVDVTVKRYRSNTGLTTTIGVFSAPAKTPYIWPAPNNLEAGDKIIAVAATSSVVVASAELSFFTSDTPIATGFTPTTVYSAAATYGINEVVYYNSGTAATTGAYVSKIAGNIGNTPSSSPTQWLQMTATGPAGAEGGIGKHAIPIVATGILGAIINGPAYTKAETTTNKNIISTLDFDAVTAESGQFFIPMPKAWNEGTITFKVLWKHNATTTNFGVAWGLSAVAYSDDDIIEAVFGTEIVVTDTGGTTNDVYHTAESAAVTVAGSPLPEDYVMFKIRRVVADAADTMAIDAGLLSVVIYITTNAGSDT